MTSPISLSRALLLSIRPKYTELILKGEKTVELRKRRPRLDPGDLIVMYASAPTCALVGAFELRSIVGLPPSVLWTEYGPKTGVSKQVFERYFDGHDEAFGLTVGRVFPLTKMVELSTLRQRWARFQPPQSYRYLRVGKPGDGVRLKFPDRTTTVSLAQAKFS